MTKDEFIRPYLLLIYQPWGKRYAMTTPEGMTQSEFYFSHVRNSDPSAWAKACELYAQGDHWPSLVEVKQSLKAYAIQPRRLTDQRRGEPMPDEIRKMLARLTASCEMD